MKVQRSRDRPSALLLELSLDIALCAFQKRKKELSSAQHFKLQSKTHFFDFQLESDDIPSKIEFETLLCDYL